MSIEVIGYAPGFAGLRNLASAGFADDFADVPSLAPAAVGSDPLPFGARIPGAPGLVPGVWYYGSIDPVRLPVGQNAARMSPTTPDFDLTGDGSQIMNSIRAFFSTPRRPPEVIDLYMQVASMTWHAREKSEAARNQAASVWSQVANNTSFLSLISGPLVTGLNIASDAAQNFIPAWDTELRDERRRWDVTYPAQQALLTYLRDLPAAEPVPAIGVVEARRQMASYVILTRQTTAFMSQTQGTINALRARDGSLNANLALTGDALENGLHFVGQAVQQIVVIAARATRGLLAGLVPWWLWPIVIYGGYRVIKSALPVVKATIRARTGIELHGADGPALDVASMTAGQINAALDKFDRQSSRLNAKFIAAGRGNERPSDWRSQNDPLAVEWRKLSDALYALRTEVRRRYGSDIHRLPPRFGPIRPIR